MQIHLNVISTFRKELMGIATILILICHAPGNGIYMPKYLEYLIVQGQIGVDIFLFLSGMGLWFSLTNHEQLTGGGESAALVCEKIYQDFGSLSADYASAHSNWLYYE